MPKQLTDLEAVEISLVAKAATGKKFLVLKSGGEPMSSAILKAVLEAPLENEVEVDEILKQKQLSQKAQEAVKGAVRLLQAYREELPEDILKTLAKAGGFPWDEAELTDEEKKKLEEKVPVSETKKAGELDLAQVPEAVRPAIQALWKEHGEAVAKVAKMEAILKAERDQRLTKEWIAKATAEYNSLAIKPDDLGPILKALEEKAPDELKRIEEVLKAADAAITAGDLFKEKGKSGAQSAGSAMEKLEQMAKSLVQKESGLSMSDALSRVMDENPGLYREYQQEVSVKV